MGVTTSAWIAIVGWLLRNERRMGTFMTRAEHDRVCDKRSEQMRETLGRIEKLVAEQSEMLTDVRVDVSAVKERIKGGWGEP